MKPLLASLVVLVGTTLGSEAQAREWAGCTDALENLISSSEDARDGAEQLSGAAEKVESARQDLSECVTFPKIYDHLGDGCQSQRSAYDDAVNDRDSYRLDLESSLEILSGSIGHTEGECGHQLVATRDERLTAYCGLLASLRTRDTDLFQAICAKNRKKCQRCLTSTKGDTKTQPRTP